MNGKALTWALTGTLLACGIAAATAQQRQAAASKPDPRVGLKAGIRDAGQAIRNMELVASLPKPDGFFDPAKPLGNPTAPEPPDGQTPQRPPFDPATANRLDFSNSDLAFDGHHLFMGSFHGYNIYDIEESHDPKLLASIVCPGGQGDVSVYKNLLFMSVEQGRGRLDCGTQGHQTEVSSERFRGVRIFDITDITKPRQVAAVQTCRGSHTHTLVPDPRDPNSIYVYGSGTSPVRPGQELEGCSGSEPKDDPNTSLFSIDVIKVPIARPSEAKIVNRPRIFMDAATGNIAGLWMGGNHGEGTQRTSATNQCHDITVFPQLGLAAGACSGNGILLDISDPEHPSRLDQVLDKNFAYWHSATFNNSGTKVIFTDEWGGGTRPRCRQSDPPTWGADAVFDIVDKKLKFGGYYKLPAPQTDMENCVAHNGSLVPVPGRDIMVQAWYQGGVSVIDFTDTAHPKEIAYLDRGPINTPSTTGINLGGYWSTYWYNGNVLGSEIARGFDSLAFTPSQFLSANEIAAAGEVQLAEFNAQAQTKLVHDPSFAVVRSFVDQAERDGTLKGNALKQVRKSIDQAEKLSAGGSASANAVSTHLGNAARTSGQPADSNLVQALDALAAAGS